MRSPRTSSAWARNAPAGSTGTIQAASMRRSTGSLLLIA
jgi:hypothetical protein